MLQITPQMRVLVAGKPIDGRKGIDSLARLCQQELGADPFSGCVFIFRNRSGTAIKVLVYDGQGVAGGAPGPGPARRRGSEGGGSAGLEEGRRSCKLRPDGTRRRPQDFSRFLTRLA